MNENNIVLQSANITSSIKIEDRLIIPFNSTIFNEYLDTALKIEDFADLYIDFHDERWYYGDYSESLISPSLDNWTLTVTDDASATVESIHMEDSPLPFELPHIFETQHAVIINILNHGDNITDIDFHNNEYMEVIQNQTYEIQFDTYFYQEVSEADAGAPVGRRIELRIVDDETSESLGFSQILDIDAGHQTHRYTFLTPVELSEGINSNGKIHFLLTDLIF